MNRVSLRIGVTASVAALGALAFSTAGASAAGQPFGKDGTIHACFKAKGKNRGALRVVPQSTSCRKLHGWRPVSWSATGSPGSVQAGAGGAAGVGGEPGSKGERGPEGKEGAQGPAGEIEKSLLETIQNQTTQIDQLTKQVTDLSGEVLALEGSLVNLSGGVANLEGDVTDLSGGLVDLEGTVGETCDQLTTLTGQADDIVTGVSGVSLNNALQLIKAAITFPNLPGPLGQFECK